MNMKTISVIVPIYNIEAYLDRCITSIVNQTYQDLEIILVNDGSNDSCPYICDKWRNKDKRIKVLHKVNGGLSDARNAGLDCITGSYVSFIDGDDWIEKDFYQTMMNIMLDHKCEIISCYYRKTNKESKIPNNAARELKLYNKEQAMYALIDNTIQQVVWNKLYKREVIGKILFEKDKIHEDEFWTYQVFSNVAKLGVIDYIGYNYFQREDSIMGKGYSIKRLDAVEAKVRRQEYLSKEMKSLESKGKINLLFTCLYHGQLSLKYLKREEKAYAMNYLKNVIDSLGLCKADYKNLKKTHQFWIPMALLSFDITCKLRNQLNIGF